MMLVVVQKAGDIDSAAGQTRKTSALSTFEGADWIPFEGAFTESNWNSLVLEFGEIEVKSWSFLAWHGGLRMIRLEFQVDSIFGIRRDVQIGQRFIDYRKLPLSTSSNCGALSGAVLLSQVKEALCEQ